MPRSPTSTTRLMPKRSLSLLDLRAQRRRVGRVAVEHLDRDRQPLARAQQPIDDLRPVTAMVAAHMGG